MLLFCVVSPSAATLSPRFINYGLVILSSLIYMYIRNVLWVYLFCRRPSSFKSGFYKHILLITYTFTVLFHKYTYDHHHHHHQSLSTAGCLLSGLCVVWLCVFYRVSCPLLIQLSLTHKSRIFCLFLRPLITLIIVFSTLVVVRE